MKKGMLHTVEAIIAFIMIVGFVILLMPIIENDTETSRQTRVYVYEALSSMEKSGKLQSLAAAQNMSGIKSELNKTIAMPLKFTVAISKPNISYGTVYPKEDELAYIYFVSDKARLESAIFSLEYSNATNPLIYANGIALSQHSGDYSGKEDTFEISSLVQNGTNTVMLNTSSDAMVSYRLMLIERQAFSEPPNNTSITTISYIISGNGTSFIPSEIRVYVWR